METTTIKTKGKKQFKGTAKPKDHYDRKVIHTGYTRSLSMGRIIPEGWQYVRLRIIGKSDICRVVEITKLLGVNNNAQTTTTDKTSEQHT